MNCEISTDVSIWKITIYNTIQPVLCKAIHGAKLEKCVLGLVLSPIHWTSYSPLWIQDTAVTCANWTMWAPNLFELWNSLRLNVPLMTEKILQDLSAPQSCQYKNQLLLNTFYLHFLVIQILENRNFFAVYVMHDEIRLLRSEYLCPLPNSPVGILTPMWWC